MINDSTFALLKSSIPRWKSRIALMRANTKLFCAIHQLQEVTDYFHGPRLAVLKCGCRRSLFDDTVTAEFEKERRKRPQGKLISKGSAPAQLEIVRELLEGEIAA